MEYFKEKNESTLTRFRQVFPFYGQCNSILHGIILALKIKNKLHSNQGIANREKQIWKSCNKF